MADNKGDNKDEEQNAEGAPNSESDSKPDTGNAGGNSGGTGEGKKDDNGSIREMVREEIQSALKDLKGDSGNGTIPRRQDIEAAAERMVKDAAERLKSQEEHERDHEKIRTGETAGKPDKPVTEDAPKKVRKLTKLLWGDGE